MAEKKLKTTIAIEGERKYKEACKDITATVRELGSKMRLLSMEYSDNAYSTKALAEKEKVLKKQLEEKTKKVLEGEKALKAYEDAGEGSSRAAKALRTDLNYAKVAVAKTEKEVNKLNDEMKASKKASKILGKGFDESRSAAKQLEEALEDAKKELEKIGDKAKEVGQKIKTGLAGAGAAVATAVVGIAKTGNDYQTAMNGFIAQTSVSADQVKEFEGVLTDIYKGNYGEGFEDIADSMAIVKQQFNDIDPSSLENITTQAIIMRDTFGYDVEESIRSVKMLMDQFGISADEAFNLLAQGTQKGLNKNGDLLDNINEYAVHYEQLGLTADEFFASLENGAKSGTFSVDKLGDGMKEFGIRVKDESEGTKQAFSDLGLDVDATSQAFAQGGDTAKQAYDEVIKKLFEMEDPLLQNQTGVALFGTTWEDLGVKGVTALTDLDGEISKNVDALGEIDKIKYDDAFSALQGVGKMLMTDLVIPVSQELLPIIEEFAQKIKDGDSWVQPLAEKMKEFINYIKDNGDKIIAIISAIGAGFAAFKIASTIVTVVGAFKRFSDALKITKGVMAALNVTMALNPAVLIAAAIVALIAGLVVLYKRCDKFRNFVDKTFKAIVNFFKNNWQSLLLLILNPIVGAFKLVYDNCEGFRTFINNFVESIRVFFAETIPSIFNAVIEFIKNNWQGLLLLLVNPFVGAFKLVYDNCEGFKSFIDGFINSVVEFFSSLPAKIKAKFDSVVSTVYEWVTNLITTASVQLPRFVSTVVSAVAELPSKFFDVGKNIVQGVWNGIKSLSTWLWDKVMNFFSNIVDGVKKKLEIQSPSRVFAEIGKFMAQGLGIGFSGQMKTVRKSIEDDIPTAFDINSKTSYSHASSNKTQSSRGIKEKQGINITQIFNNPKRDYANEQRKAAKEFKLVARMV